MGEHSVKIKLYKVNVPYHEETLEQSLSVVVLPGEMGLCGRPPTRRWFTTENIQQIVIINYVSTAIHGDSETLELTQYMYDL